jgi:energy-coupling factor transport system permease protein
MPALAPADAALLARLAPPTPTAWHRLNPLTRAVIAAVATIAAFALSGYSAPVVILATLVLPGAIVARVLRRVVWMSLAVSAPIGISVALVSILTRAGSTVLVEIGPFEVTLEGIDFAAQVILRLLAMAAALALFGLTTPPRALVADLERRGGSPRLAYAIGAVLDTVPATLERARAVRDAQRARGLDTEGGILRRARGVLPLVGPVVLGALHDVEGRSLALEARAFGRAGPRRPLWTPADTPAERLVRWLLLAALLVAIVGAATGGLAGLP